MLNLHVRLSDVVEVKLENYDFCILLYILIKIVQETFTFTVPKCNDQQSSKPGSLKKKSWSSEKLIQFILQAWKNVSEGRSNERPVVKSTAAVSLIIIVSRLFACQKKEYECWPRFEPNDFHSRNEFVWLFYSETTFTSRPFLKDSVIKKLAPKHALMWLNWSTVSQTDKVVVNNVHSKLISWWFIATI